jgi:hypothetical protein
VVTHGASAGEGSDPKLLNKCANFFIEHQQFSKACAMLVNAKEYDRALRMALDHQVYSLMLLAVGWLSTARETQDNTPSASLGFLNTRL